MVSNESTIKLSNGGWQDRRVASTFRMHPCHLELCASANKLICFGRRPETTCIILRLNNHPPSGRIDQQIALMSCYFSQTDSSRLGLQVFISPRNDVRRCECPTQVQCLHLHVCNHCSLPPIATQAIFGRTSIQHTHNPYPAPKWPLSSSTALSSAARPPPSASPAQPTASSPTSAATLCASTAPRTQSQARQAPKTGRSHNIGTKRKRP